MIVNNLSKEDIKLVKSWGYLDEDLRQINEAIDATTYELDGKPISQLNAIKILGRERYLSGICRSAFHWSAARKDINEKNLVLFDSSRLFD